jgi:putative molybdopterin biosynthesis protein
MNEQTFTPDEIANLFKISKHTVYELIKRGELHAFKVGNKMRIEESEVDRFKESMKATPKVDKNSSSRLGDLSGYSVKVTGSHDFVIEHLLKVAKKELPTLSIIPAYIGSLEGLMTLYRGGSDIAAIHLFDPSTQTYNLPFINQLFVHEPITLVRIAAREQGILVKRGNPKNIHGFDDLVRKDVTFTNRQKGSGTRFIFDSYLSKHNIDPSYINGYDSEEWNHLSTATSVRSGVADCAFGIRSAAIQLDLDFIPITIENFDLVFRWTDLNKQALTDIMNLIQTQQFLESVKSIDGYDFSQLGTIIYDRQ